MMGFSFMMVMVEAFTGLHEVEVGECSLVFMDLKLERVCMIATGWRVVRTH